MCRPSGIPSSKQSGLAPTRTGPQLRRESPRVKCASRAIIMENLSSAMRPKTTLPRLPTIPTLPHPRHAFLYVGLGYVLGKTTDDKSYRQLSVFREVLQHIQEDYVDEPNMAVVTSAAMHGLLESLDPLSGYLSPREYADYRDRTKNAVHAEAGMP